jgi:citrate lyase synthetase
MDQEESPKKVSPGEAIKAVTEEMDQAYKSGNMEAFYAAREKVIQMFKDYGYTKG